MLPSFNIGTRKSPLALKQVELVLNALSSAYAKFAREYAVQTIPIVTSGDQLMDAKLAEFGGKGLFTKEIDEALLSGRVDIAVHSAKDIQTTLPEGLEFVAALPREDARDVLISRHGYTLASLPEGARIGTSSLRRALMLKHHRPDAQILPIRGNIQTRMGKIEVGEFDATILALAGIKRMGLQHSSSVVLELDEMLPAPAQGIIAIQCRADDLKTKALLQKINHVPSMIAAQIERKILKRLDGSCKTPIAAYAEHTPHGVLVRSMLGHEESGKISVDQVIVSVTDHDNALEVFAKKLQSQL